MTSGHHAEIHWALADAFARTLEAKSASEHLWALALAVGPDGPGRDMWQAADGTPVDIVGHIIALQRRIDRWERRDREDAAARLPHRTLTEVILEVSAASGISTARLLGRERTQRVVKIRSLAMAIGRDLSGLSLAGVGQAFDGRDPTTVSAAIAKTERRMTTDYEVQNMDAIVRDRLYRSRRAVK